MKAPCIELLIAVSLSIPWAFGHAATDHPKDIGQASDGKLRPARFPGREEAYLPVIRPSSHAANLIVLKNGDVLCFWFTGSWEGESGVGIAVSRLARGSRQWTTPLLIDSKQGESYQNPVPFQAPDGTLWLLHTTQPSGQGQSDARVLVVKSHDDGRSWSEPKVLFNKPGSFIRNPLVVMPAGGWLLPMYYTPSKGITTGAESNYSVIKISHDHGRSWTDCPVPQSNGYVQPSVLRLPNGSYIAFFRSRFADWIFKSTSNDGCRWTPPVKTVLPNNNASIQAALLADNHIVIAFDDSSATHPNGKPQEGPRKPLSVALSADYGATWRWIRKVEAGRPSATQALEKEKLPGREEYSYPSILQDPNGDLDLAFTYRRETIKFLRFPESWIKANGPAR